MKRLSALLGIMTIALMMMPNLIRAGPIIPDTEMAIAQDVTTVSQAIVDNYAYAKILATAPMNITAHTALAYTRAPTSEVVDIGTWPTRAPATASLTGQIASETAHRTSSPAAPAQALTDMFVSYTISDGAEGTISPLVRSTQQADLLNDAAKFLKGNGAWTARNANSATMRALNTTIPSPANHLLL